MNIVLRFSLASLAVVSLASCGMTVENVHYAWPVESVLPVGDDNIVQDGRHSLQFSVAAIAEEEFENVGALRGKEIRLLRSVEGYYFLTAKRFKHVYVLKPAPSELRLESRIAVAPNGLQDPAFNQRPPYVELLDGGKAIRLTSDEIVEGKK
jgi:hypothetical protein